MVARAHDPIEVFGLWSYGLSQKQIAGMTGVSESAISQALGNPYNRIRPSKAPKETPKRAIVAARLPGILRDLTRFARTLTRDAEATADLVQDTCVHALVKADLFDADSDLRKWCFTLMRNLFLGEKRHDSVARNYRADLAWRSSHSANGGQEAAVLLGQVLAFGARCREFHPHLMAMEAAGCTVAEMAAHYGVPEGTAKSRVCRGRKAVREAFAAA